MSPLRRWKARTTALALLAAVGCGHRGLRFPGPLDRMGADPGDYVDRFYDDEPSDAGSGDVANPRLRRRIHRDGLAVADAAGDFVGKGRLTVHGESFRYDCSGFVEAAHAKAGEPVRGSTKDLYALAERTGTLHKKKRPYVGDVVFWDDTYDRNGNGRRDDDLTHIGIVEGVARDGRVTIIHLGGTGVRRITMDLRHKRVHTDEGGVLRNDYLRVRREDDPWRTKYLAGELWVAYASPWRRSEP